MRVNVTDCEQLVPRSLQDPASSGELLNANCFDMTFGKRHLGKSELLNDGIWLKDMKMRRFFSMLQETAGCC